ncbi:PREDICTED: probable glutathione peroxidase 8 isoform X3 [Miniopterus natalensis]|uniref:probable glutathione peroxidase 8 isoform X3 n=1 Tax=Miniopterus natalensis TaxID=291302 RepID=UPI0007A713D7|nr:PREDICTED: probable glutathione peroxidase 8 isoform X3 [Miniopterus natalensis]
MEPLAAQPLRCSGPRARLFAVLLSMALCTGTLFLLQLKFLKPKVSSFYTFEVKDAKGRPVSLEKFRGKILQRKNQDGIFGNIWSTPRVKL